MVRFFHEKKENISMNRPNNKLTTLPQLIDVLGIRIALHRKKMGWTQNELARRMKVNQVTIAVWETGGQVPSRIYLDKLCILFGINRYIIEKSP